MEPQVAPIGKPYTFRPKEISLRISFLGVSYVSSWESKLAASVFLERCISERELELELPRPRTGRISTAQVPKSKVRGMGP